MPGLPGDFTGNALLQAIVEFLRGDRLPIDVQTGEVVDAQSGVVAPSVGRPLSPFRVGYFDSLVVAGLEVRVNDIANFSPTIITRDATAPATGQHPQTYIWPFEGLSRAIVYLVGPQVGGGGGDGGFYIRPTFRDIRRSAASHVGNNDATHSATVPVSYSGQDVLDNPEVARLYVPAGTNGTASVSSILLSGLTQGSELNLSFGTGGAGGAGGVGASYPATRSYHLRIQSQDYWWYDGGLGWSAGLRGGVIDGATRLSYGGASMRMGGVDSLDFEGLTLPDGAGITSYVSFPGGAGDTVAATTDKTTGVLPVNFLNASGVATGAGGLAGVPAQGDTGDPIKAGDGTAGQAGHNGFVLIFPQT